MATATRKAKSGSAGKGPQLQPLNDRVVVRRDEAETKTAGGLVLPSGSKDKPTRGVVVCVGPGKMTESGKRTTMQVKAGDRVVFSTWAGENFKIGDDELLLISQDDIHAVLEG